MVRLDGWTDFLGDPHQVETELRSALTGAAKRLLPDVEVRTSKEWGMMATSMHERWNQWSWKYQTIPCGRIKTKPYQKNLLTSCGDLEGKTPDLKGAKSHFCTVFQQHRSNSGGFACRAPAG